MELIYLYIEDDEKNIKDCEFNFSPEYKIHYDKNENQLSVDKRDDYVPNFWEADNVFNITAIIGKNGSGKSNLLEFITRYYINGLNDNQRRKKIIHLYKSNETYFINRTDVLIKDSTILCLEIKDYIQYPLNNSQKKPTTSILYYSPHYEKNVLSGMGQGTREKARDISNGGLLRDFGQDRLYYKNNGAFDTFFDIERLIIEDTLRQIELFEFSRADFFENIHIPQILQFKMHTSSGRIEQKNILYEKLYNPNLLHELTFIEHIRNRFLNQIFANQKDIEHLNLTSDMQFEDVVSLTPCGNFYSQLLKLYEDGFIIFQSYKERMGLRSNYPLSFGIKREGLSFDFIIAFYKYYFKGDVFSIPNTLEHIRVLHSETTFNWQGISAGELEYFNLLSRIYCTLQNVTINHKEKTKKNQKHDHIKNVILLLDEPENAFHPEWQRLFISNLIHFLKNSLPYYNFQIILASHSPILVSDFPKGNIIFLDKTDEGNCRVVDSITQENTFGANIHTLYRNSFFLEGLPIGEFAKKKINKLFDRLQKGDKDKSIEKEIQLVGEPLLREQLMKLYYNNFPDRAHERIKLLENELKKLKEERDDTN